MFIPWRRTEYQKEERKRAQYAIILNLVALLPKTLAEHHAKTAPIETIELYLKAMEKKS